MSVEQNTSFRCVSCRRVVFFCVLARISCVKWAVLMICVSCLFQISMKHATRSELIVVCCFDCCLSPLVFRRLAFVLDVWVDEQHALISGVHRFSLHTVMRFYWFTIWTYSYSELLHFSLLKIVPNDLWRGGERLRDCFSIRCATYFQ